MIPREKRNDAKTARIDPPAGGKEKKEKGAPWLQKRARKGQPPDSHRCRTAMNIEEKGGGKEKAASSLQQRRASFESTHACSANGEGGGGGFR